MLKIAFLRNPEIKNFLGEHAPKPPRSPVAFGPCFPPSFITLVTPLQLSTSGKANPTTVFIYCENNVFPKKILINII